MAEIKIWLYGPSSGNWYDRLSYPRVMTLENPIFQPDPAAFRSAWESLGRDQELLVLQGHPDQWNTEARWQGFMEIVKFLEGHGYVFTTPSGYAEILAKRNVRRGTPQR